LGDRGNRERVIVIGAWRRLATDRSRDYILASPAVMRLWEVLHGKAA
jgi:hypothetical protein